MKKRQQPVVNTEDGYVPPKTRRTKDISTGAVISSIVGATGTADSKLFVPLVDVVSKVRKNNLKNKKEK